MFSTAIILDIISISLFLILYLLGNSALLLSFGFLEKLIDFFISTLQSRAPALRVGIFVIFSLFHRYYLNL